MIGERAEPPRHLDNGSSNCPVGELIFSQEEFHRLLWTTSDNKHSHLRRGRLSFNRRHRSTNSNRLLCPMARSEPMKSLPLLNLFSRSSMRSPSRCLLKGLFRACSSNRATGGVKATGAQKGL